MPRIATFAALPALAACLAAPHAHAGVAGATLPDVAIVAAASNTQNPETNTRFTDPRDKLMATGLFNSVSIFNATQFNPTGGTPTLEQLQQWDAVLVWSNDSFQDAVAMGDVLADYVDSGGGVVVAVFTNTSLNTARFLQGRWQTADYIAIPQNGNFFQATGGLGQILIPDHPIFDGVDTFLTSTGVTQGGQLFGGYRPNNMTVTPGSTKVATWNTGHTLVAIAPNPRVVELGFHPVSSAVNAGYWDQTTDGARLMANALLFTIPEATSCPGDLNGDNVVDFEDLSEVLGGFGVDYDFNDLSEVLANFGNEC
ncbi:MAG: hypothetical protein EA379_01000 [Phycisphaerales bacterium]|nr:MAG: hypothetical protein EA379_01000 [Phycisphaerales bacterium]